MTNPAPGANMEITDDDVYADWLNCRFPAGTPAVPDWSDVKTAFRAGAIVRDIAALEKDALPVVPDDVRAAVNRMCMPLHESRLAGATAQADARCMAKIKAFIDSLSSAPQPALPVVPATVPEDSIQAAGDAFNRTFHKVRAEVSMDWWQRIWKLALEWQAQTNSPPVVPEGFVLAPIEPTEEMVRAGYLHKHRDAYDPEADVYRAMLAAAPQPGNAQQEKDHG